MTNVQIGKVEWLLTIAGLSFDDIARQTAARREEVIFEVRMPALEVTNRLAIDSASG